MYIYIFYFLPISQIVQKISQWKTFKAEILKKETQKKYKTFILDSADLS